MELGFAGLHHLLVPFLGGIEALPRPQADALRRAFGLAAGPPPDRLLVGSPVARCCWRRPHRNRCCASSTTRSGSIATRWSCWASSPAGSPSPTWARCSRCEIRATRLELRDLPQLSVAGLSASDSEALLHGVWDGELDPRAGKRLAVAAEGNPLALVEFARALTPPQRLGREPAPEPPLAGTALRYRFASEVAALPPAAQTVVLLAATEPSGDPALLWRAARSLGVREAVARSAGLDALVQLTPAVEFRHPLIRSAVYGRRRGADGRFV